MEVGGVVIVVLVVVLILIVRVAEDIDVLADIGRMAVSLKSSHLSWPSKLYALGPRARKPSSPTASAGKLPPRLVAKAFPTESFNSTVEACNSPNPAS